MSEYYAVNCSICGECENNWRHVVSYGPVVIKGAHKFTPHDIPPPKVGCVSVPVSDSERVTPERSDKEIQQSVSVPADAPLLVEELSPIQRLIQRMRSEPPSVDVLEQGADALQGCYEELERMASPPSSVAQARESMRNAVKALALSVLDGARLDSELRNFDPTIDALIVVCSQASDWQPARSVSPKTPSKWEPLPARQPDFAPPPPARSASPEKE